ncbi:TIR domain-containing protein [Saccharopolyspora flava]|uniref:TIR domain-containing protein n=1 Tax=Saccharopolyspora flava TaxID=95161 RepID=A0A1I6RP45_9PSEU|nr:TIR domain-containing protein [Saccharopolyspora flava]SFS66479.1 TIR domain-containing protein [Saccharopolyspora flava]
MPEIFVNYRTGDSGEFAAVPVEKALSDRFGDKLVFRDANMDPGEDYRTRLNRESSTTTVLLVLMGAGWAKFPDERGHPRLAREDDFIRLEILNAMRAGARIIPVHCGRGLPHLDPRDLPAELEFLAYLNALDFDVRNAEDDLDRLARHLVKLVPALDDRQEEPRSSGGVRNYDYSTGDGPRVQAGTIYGGLQMGGTTTHFNAPTSGPHHSGSGNQFVQRPKDDHR